MAARPMATRRTAEADHRADLHEVPPPAPGTAVVDSSRPDAIFGSDAGPGWAPDLQKGQVGLRWPR